MMIRNILILTVIAALVPTAMSNVSASAGSEIALFSGVSGSDGLSISGNGDTAKMELKATNENGKTTKVSDFQMNADNVLYIKIGDKVTVNDNVDFTKAIATDGNNNQKAIGITSNGVIDFTGYAQGLSTLDVVVDDDRAYEGIIVIGQQPPEVINKQVTKVNNNQETKVEFVVREPPKPPKCDEGEELKGNKCVPIPCDEELIDGKCPDPVPCDEELIDGRCPDPVPCDEELIEEYCELPGEKPIPVVNCYEGWHSDASGTCQPDDQENPTMPSCDLNPNQPDCEIPTEEFTSEGIDCDKDPAACGVEFPEEEEEEEGFTGEEEEVEEEEEGFTGEEEEVEEESSEEEDSGGSESEGSEDSGGSEE
jgi:hypothetical protein